MISKVLSLGDRLEITKPVSGEKKKELIEQNSIYAKPLVSQIYDIIDDTQLRIAMPIVEGRVIPLPENARFDVCFFATGGLYKSKFVVTNRYKENGLFILVIELVQELRKYQRRQYYRLEYTREVEYLVVDKEQAEELSEDDGLIREMLDHNGLKKGIIVDISGGGVRFSSSEKLEPGTTILIKLDLSNNDGKSIYGVKAEVLRSEKMISNDRIFEQRVEYLEIPNNAREIIIKHIFETERRMRQRN